MAMAKAKAMVQGVSSCLSWSSSTATPASSMSGLESSNANNGRVSLEFQSSIFMCSLDSRLEAALPTLLSLLATTPVSVPAPVPSAAPEPAPAPASSRHFVCPSPFTFVDHEARRYEVFCFLSVFFCLFICVFAPLVFNKMFQIVAHCKHFKNLRLTNFEKMFQTAAERVRRWKRERERGLLFFLCSFLGLLCAALKVIRGPPRTLAIIKTRRSDARLFPQNKRLRQRT